MMAPTSLDVRCWRLRVEWKLAQDYHAGPILEPFAIPSVPLVKQLDVVDGWALRDRFLGLPPRDSEALEFLRAVGVWELSTFEADLDACPYDQRIAGPLAGRFVRARVMPVPLSRFWRHQTYWRKKFSEKKKLLRLFGPPPKKPWRPGAVFKDDWDFAITAHHLNQLSVRVEWQGGKAVAVRDVLTGEEMLVATLHADLLRGIVQQICYNPDCSKLFLPHTPRQRYCELSCASKHRQKRHRRREKARVTK